MDKPEKITTETRKRGKSRWLHAPPWSQNSSAPSGRMEPAKFFRAGRTLLCLRESVFISVIRVKYSFILAALAIIFAAGCKNNVAEDATQPPSSVAALPSAAQLLPDLIHTREIERITRRGILLARVRCDRKPLCFHDEYGVPAGFEVDLLQKIARALGVKLNIVEDPDAPADIEAPALRPSPADDDPSLTSPYLFRAPGEWRCFRVPSADPSLRAALDRLLRHLYETGTYQQVYINWFATETTG